jgi:hypothetical protein
MEYTDDDIETTLLPIYFDGWCSGFGTSVTEHGVNDQLAMWLAQAAANRAATDPAVIETIREQIRARMRGERGKPTSIRMMDS